MINVRIISDLLSLIWFSYVPGLPFLLLLLLLPFSGRFSSSTDDDGLHKNEPHKNYRSPTTTQFSVVAISSFIENHRGWRIKIALNGSSSISGGRGGGGREGRAGRRSIELARIRYWISDINLVPFMCNCNECAIVGQRGGGGRRHSFAYECSSGNNWKWKRIKYLVCCAFF